MARGWRVPSDENGAMNETLSTYLSGANGAFIAELYERWLVDPNGVDASWRAVFDGLSEDAAAVGAEIKGPSWSRGPRAKVIGAAEAEAPAKRNGKSAPAAVGDKTVGVEQIQAATRDSVRALMLIRAYRIRGHLEANLDPLNLKAREHHPELEPATYGFTDADLDRPIFIDGVLGLTNPTLRQIMQVLRETYCGSIGVEFMHMSDPDQKAWIQERIESIRNHTEFTAKGKKAILERLTAAEKFEQFLDKKYTGTKRFGLEGGEATIPALEQILKRGGQLGLREVCIGMPHRGRLNVLANFMSKPYAAIFSEFQGQPANPEDVQGSGDVKYHSAPRPIASSTATSCISRCRRTPRISRR
jgi:2-oxoglutarate dehydrogenase E1 component